MEPETLRTSLIWLLTTAWLLPLASFVVLGAAGPWFRRTSRLPGYLATSAMLVGFGLSVSALTVWVASHQVELWGARQGEVRQAAHEAAHAGGVPAHHEAADSVDAAATTVHAGPGPSKLAVAGRYYTLAKIGPREISLECYIDGLTLVMFAMITLVASCIHVFALAYLQDELTEDHVDHEVHLSGNRHFHRPGRLGRFYTFLSLFCFSMLGLVLAGNLFQVFMFWELVGLCSYLLIGFYGERHTAGSAANKAFIVNRIGDAGFLIGLSILWTCFGVFHFANLDAGSPRLPGLFELDVNPALQASFLAGQNSNPPTADAPSADAVVSRNAGPFETLPGWLLTAAGLGIFAGCVGKSAQFPLHVWLPDAMEGPTPVSALVHSATMVAAGVYLAGRFDPLLTPDARIVIAYVGCLTLFIGATIAMVAVDIKRVLACSTISQLGYMILAIGVGGWLAGIFHLITHAFFKSLLFLCSGSVIHACGHEQNMTRLGGLHRKLPVTTWCTFVGVVAICGLAVPLLPPVPVFGPIAFSGYHSKDSILATLLAFASLNPSHSLLFLVPLLTAGLTAFYMFRMWYLTFFGTSRTTSPVEAEREASWCLKAPLCVLAFFAITIGMAGENGPLVGILGTAEPVRQMQLAGAVDPHWTLPTHLDIQRHHTQAGAAALCMAFGGTLLATLFYALNQVSARAIQQRFSRINDFLQHQWHFDDLYDVTVLQPLRRIAAACVWLDRCVLDPFLNGCARLVVSISGWDRRFDEAVVDGAVNLTAQAFWQAGRQLRFVQTGRLRHYVMSITVCVVAIFILLFLFLPGRS